MLSPGAWIGDLVPALRSRRGARAAGARLVPAAASGAGSALDAFPVGNLAFEEGRYYLFPTGASRASRSASTTISARPAIPTRLRARPRGRGRGRSPPLHRRYFPDADGPVMALARLPVHQHARRALHHRRLPGSRGRARRLALLRARLQVRRVVGEIVADLVATGRSRFDLSMFRLPGFEDTRRRAYCISPAMATSCSGLGDLAVPRSDAIHHPRSSLACRSSGLPKNGRRLVPQKVVEVATRSPAAIMRRPGVVVREGLRRIAPRIAFPPSESDRAGPAPSNDRRRRARTRLRRDGRATPVPQCRDAALTPRLVRRPRGRSKVSKVGSSHSNRISLPPLCAAPVSIPPRRALSMARRIRHAVA